MWKRVIIVIMVVLVGAGFVFGKRLLDGNAPQKLATVTETQSAPNPAPAPAAEKKNETVIIKRQDRLPAGIEDQPLTPPPLSEIINGDGKGDKGTDEEETTEDLPDPADDEANYFDFRNWRSGN